MRLRNIGAEQPIRASDCCKGNAMAQRKHARNAISARVDARNAGGGQSPESSAGVNQFPALPSGAQRQAFDAAGHRHAGLALQAQRLQRERVR